MVARQVSIETPCGRIVRERILGMFRLHSYRASAARVPLNMTEELSGNRVISTQQTKRLPQTTAGEKQKTQIGLWD